MDAKAKTIVAEDHGFEALPAPDRSLKMPTIEAADDLTAGKASMPCLTVRLRPGFRDHD